MATNRCTIWLYVVYMCINSLTTLLIWSSRRTYGLLFDWLYPSRMPLLLKAISLCADEPEVTTKSQCFPCVAVLFEKVWTVFRKYLEPYASKSFAQLLQNHHFVFMQVTTPLLKFMCEFVLNKAQRLTFDSSSPNGILLFREVSKLIVAYGSRILLLPNGTDIYGSKYKGIWISLAVLSRGEFRKYVLKTHVCSAILLQFQ